jgi:hypothetical protein
MFALLQVHGEQFLIANLLLHKERSLQSLAISAAPCGHCRQFYSELACAVSSHLHYCALLCINVLYIVALLCIIVLYIVALLCIIVHYCIVYCCVIVHYRIVLHCIAPPHATKKHSLLHMIVADSAIPPFLGVYDLIWHPDMVKASCLPQWQTLL